MPVNGNPVIVPPVLSGYSPYIKTKQELKAYIWRKLGGEAVNIELTDDNLNDAISDTLEVFMKYAYDGMIERYVPIALESGKQTYQLPYETFAVLGVHTLGVDGGIVGGVPSNMFSINQYVASDLYRAGKLDLLTYELVNNMLSTIDVIFGKKETFEFNSISRNLHLFEVPKMASNALVHAYLRNVPTYDQSGVEASNIYSELWVREYSVAKAKYQWATNLMKYSGSTLPGGITIDVPTMLTEANTILEKLETQLKEENQLPPMFFVG